MARNESREGKDSEKASCGENDEFFINVSLVVRFMVKFIVNFVMNSKMSFVVSF